MAGQVFSIVNVVVVKGRLFSSVNLVVKGQVGCSSANLEGGVQTPRSLACACYVNLVVTFLQCECGFEGTAFLECGCGRPGGLQH